MVHHVGNHGLIAPADGGERWAQVFRGVRGLIEVGVVKRGQVRERIRPDSLELLEQVVHRGVPVRFGNGRGVEVEEILPLREPVRPAVNELVEKPGFAVHQVAENPERVIATVCRGVA